TAGCVGHFARAYVDAHLARIGECVTPDGQGLSRSCRCTTEVFRIAEMRVSLMIEGQDEVSWDQWLAIAQAAEAAGLEGLFRSDHYLGLRWHGRVGGLDAWS